MTAEFMLKILTKIHVHEHYNTLYINILKKFKGKTHKPTVSK